jgi:hypothetical protein
MSTNDLKELSEIVERLRLEMHPDLDKNFLQAVVCAEEANPDDDGDAVTVIQRALDSLLQRTGTT